MQGSGCRTRLGTASLRGRVQGLPEELLVPACSPRVLCESGTAFGVRGIADSRDRHPGSTELTRQRRTTGDQAQRESYLVHQEVAPAGYNHRAA